MAELLTKKEIEDWRDKFLPDCSPEEIDEFRVRAVLTLEFLHDRLAETLKKNEMYYDALDYLQQMVKRSDDRAIAEAALDGDEKLLYKLLDHNG